MRDTDIHKSEVPASRGTYLGKVPRIKPPTPRFASTSRSSPNSIKYQPLFSRTTSSQNISNGAKTSKYPTTSPVTTTLILTNPPSKPSALVRPYHSLTRTLSYHRTRPADQTMTNGAVYATSKRNSDRRFGSTRKCKSSAYPTNPHRSEFFFRENKTYAGSSGT